MAQAFKAGPALFAPTRRAPRSAAETGVAVTFAGPQEGVHVGGSAAVSALGLWCHTHRWLVWLEPSHTGHTHPLPGFGGQHEIMSSRAHRAVTCQVAQQGVWWGWVSVASCSPQPQRAGPSIVARVNRDRSLSWKAGWMDYGNWHGSCG